MSRVIPANLAINGTQHQNHTDTANFIVSDLFTLLAGFGGFMDFNERKQERKRHYEKNVKGWRLVNCLACSGSGHYRDGECGACEGTGKERQSPRFRNKL